MTDALTCRNHPDTVESLRHCARCTGVFCSDCLVDVQGLPYCASCKNEQLRDITSGVDLSRLDIASIGPRLGALLIDGLVLGIPFWTVIFAVFFRDVFQGVIPTPQKIQPIAWIYAGTYFLYDGFMTARRGQTFGKIALKLKVVRPDGTPISGAQGWGRALVRSAMVSLLSLVNYLAAVFTKERTCIHDLVAKTRVVRVA